MLVHFTSHTRIIFTNHLHAKGSTFNPISVGTPLEYNIQGFAGEIWFTSEENPLR
jgi:hypothetical protein